MIDILSLLFKPDLDEIQKEVINRKLDSYCYGVEVGKRVKSHFKTIGIKNLPTIPLVKNENSLPFYLGFKKGLNNIDIKTSYLVEELDNCIDIPFAVDFKHPTEIIKDQSKNSNIYLRHS